jgi:hypothetical protein
MFEANLDHCQTGLFEYRETMPEEMQKELQKSDFAVFYRLVFCAIREEDFACLYSKTEGRPNAPVNCLVAGILLMNNYNWSFDELIEHVRFDLLTKTALGLRKIGDMPFTERTIFNFKNRLNDYFVSTGIDLMEHLYDGLTKRQTKELKIKTNIQRTDSFQAGSNVRVYTRLQLLVEMVVRMHRILTDEDKQKYADLFAPYIAKSSGKYIYALAPGDLPKEMQTIGQVYHRIYTEIYPLYADRELFGTFERIFAEQFLVINDTIEVRPNADMTSDCLQSPDDEDATYRKKSGKEYRGQVVSITETANPENELQLITDVAVLPNNVDDSRILNERLEGLKEKTPDLEILMTDGTYPSPANDELCQKLGITMIQTGIKGAKSNDVELAIEQNESQEYTVSCPHQKVTAEPTKTGFKACFDKAACASCPLASNCKHSKGRYYFKHDDYQRKKRQSAIWKLPPEHRTLRANVEATVRQCKRGMNNGKLKVRGYFETAFYSYSRVIMVNYGRICRHIRKKARECCPTVVVTPVTG